MAVDMTQELEDWESLIDCGYLTFTARRGKARGNIIILHNVQFGDVEIRDHVWVKRNKSLTVIKPDTPIRFQARLYRYLKNDGRYQVGVRDVQKCKVIE